MFWISAPLRCGRGGPSRSPGQRECAPSRHAVRRNRNIARAWTDPHPMGGAVRRPVGGLPVRRTMLAGPGVASGRERRKWPQRPRQRTPGAATRRLGILDERCGTGELFALSPSTGLVLARFAVGGVPLSPRRRCGTGSCSSAPCTVSSPSDRATDRPSGCWRRSPEALADACRRTRRAPSSPFDQLPHIGSQLARATADLREQCDGPLEVFHGFVRPTVGVEQGNCSAMLRYNNW